MTGGGNITEITEFILLGFSDFPRIIVVLFVVFLVIYILTLTWNLSMLGLCDLPQLLVLSCTDTFFLHLLTVILTMIFGIINVSVIMISYIYIVISIMKITTASGRSKAFNTCASHLTAVTLFYTSGMFVYLSFSSGGSSSFDRFASFFYTVMIPMLNPLIYSLRNKEIKDALRRLQKKSRYC
ncbi:olfactory receptor 5AN1-like [Oryx dammah]|uniref:olfactory receptor 5AN1-like n=1 Tax=Oryx dammah TaxID=59534 RepID=UPI001A9A84AC|nr:olfactory receptor 5AN1-like [Oryx dammah]